MESESNVETSSDESTTKKSKPFICTYTGCKAAFSKSRKLINHTRKHTGERPFVCDEPNCNKNYTNSSHLRRHKKVYHEGHSERASCNVVGCYKEFANKLCLKKHCNRFHNPKREYPFTCDECSQGFHRKRQLQQHSYLHSGILPFSCDGCEAKFSTTRDCNRHKRTHTKYPCDCGEVFERWTVLLRHRKECERRAYTCSVCDKKFSNGTNLNQHLQIHKDKDDKDVYVCPYENCLRYYFYKKNLAHHIKKLHERLPKPKIPCKYEGCNKLFSKMQNYKAHLLRHSEPKKQKERRKPRKDKGSFRKSALSELCGINLPLQVEKSIITGDKIDLKLDVIPSLQASSSNHVNEYVNTDVPT